jgi:hypothetical protein
MNIVDDVLTIILSYTDVRNILVCKKWKEIIMKSSFVCKACGKITYSFGKSLWYSTHAIYNLPCHAFYDKIYISSYWDKLKYYEQLPTMKQCRGICLDAVHTNGLYLRDVHKVYRTPEIYLAAINNKAESIQYIDEQDLSPTLIKKAVLKNGIVLSFIPLGYQSNDIIHTALKNNGMALQYVLIPITLLMCYTAIKQNGLALQFVPHEMIDKCIIKALKHNGCAIQYVPHHFITEKICRQALNSSISAVHYIPKEYQHIISDYGGNYSHAQYLKWHYPKLTNK